MKYISTYKHCLANKMKKKEALMCLLKESSYVELVNVRIRNLRDEANEKTSVKILQLPAVGLSVKGGDLDLNPISVISSRVKPGNSPAYPVPQHPPCVAEGKDDHGTFSRREKRQWRRLPHRTCTQ